MDCETFERIVLDRVFLELDDLTTGAAQRHVAHCSRCRTIEVGLRATRDVCRLPQVVPMEGFAECVVARERQIHAGLPLRQRVNRAVSVLASYAMRPQPTMAALLLLMIGASLFLVRARPAERDLVQVTERGVPEVDLEARGDKNATLANYPVVPIASLAASSNHDCGLDAGETAGLANDDMSRLKRLKCNEANRADRVNSSANPSKSVPAAGPRPHLH